MNRVPTEKQYAFLRMLGDGSACVTHGIRDTQMYLRRGWVTADLHASGKYYTWLRITAVGLHALAEAVAKYGLPAITGPVKVRRFECRRCGSTDVISRAAAPSPDPGPPPTGA